MKDQNKTKPQLLDELKELRKRIGEYGAVKAENTQSEEALRKSEEKFRMLAKLLPVGVFITDKQGYGIYWNDLLFEITGLQAEEAKGEGWVIALHPEDRERVYEEWNISIKNREKFKSEYRFIDRRGNITWAIGEASSIRGPTGEISGYVGSITDITEHKRVEERLRFLSLISEQVSDSVLATNLNFEITWANSAFERLYGYSLDEIRGQSPDFLNAEPDSKQIQQKIYQTISSGKPWKREVLNRKKDGSIFPCELLIFPLVNERGDIFAYSGHQRDISERKKAEEALQQAHDLLEEKVKERTAELQEANVQLKQEIHERMGFENALREREKELEKQRVALEQKNITLREVIAQIEIEKRKIIDDIKANVQVTITPILQKLESNKSAQDYAALLRHHIEGLTSSFGSEIRDKSVQLTPKEIEICNAVKGGLSNKDISRLLNISYKTVEGHRKNIRRKLGISNKKVNLASFLRQL